MKPLRGAILTDHRAHSDQNSVYALATALSAHPQVAQLHIASRFNPLNDVFFEHQATTVVQALEVQEDFAFDATGQQFQQNTHPVDLTTVDFVLLRLPRPVDDAFLQYLIAALPHVVMINHPAGIIKTSSKAFLLEVAQWCPPMQLCHTAEAVQAFAQKFPIVLKPLREYGGKGIVRVENGQVYAGKGGPPQALEVYLKHIEDAMAGEGYLAMQFLQHVDQGDKRILVVGGQIMGSSLRLPPKGSWLCNVAQGGRSLPAEPDEAELAMIAALAPRLQQEGILMFGMDTLMGNEGQRVLSEINTLSIGGFPQAEAQTGQPVLKRTADLILQHIQSQLTT